MTSEHLLERYFIGIDLWELYILILYNHYSLDLEAMLLLIKVFVHTLNMRGPLLHIVFRNSGPSTNVAE